MLRLRHGNIVKQEAGCRTGGPDQCRAWVDKLIILEVKQQMDIVNLNFRIHFTVALRTVGRRKNSSPLERHRASSKAYRSTQWLFFSSI